MINLNYRDSRPLYEQIHEELRRLLISGAYLPGERLPSVRELASTLAINPNTIQRAYRELESEGYIYSIPGKGSFVSETDEAGGQRQGELMNELGKVLRELRHLNTAREEIVKSIDEIYGEAKV